jgi:GDP/UDP-N,N'-diacetylbacillosamine 2-epimerase (hydrolysing)
MKIGVLTSSRADYGIYLPLLSKLKNDNFFDLEIIAFGTHLSTKYSMSINEIKKDGYNIIHEISSFVDDDSEKGIVISYANTIAKFSKFWDVNKYNLVLCLGDRFEVNAAVQASIPFGVNFAHLHGGETTLGAIDNVYRHQISLVSQIHFVASKQFFDKVREITGKSENIYNVGALSLDGIKDLELPKWSDVRNIYNIPDKEFILITFHPETINPNKNQVYIKIISEVLTKLTKNFHLVICLANADTNGSFYRESSRRLKNKYPEKISLVENFGKYNYFAAMKASKVLLGNSSSAILEAASFGKYAVNVGRRQLGRLRSNNIIDVPYNTLQIINSLKKIKNFFKEENKYYRPNSALNIIKILKENEFKKSPN